MLRKRELEAELEAIKVEMMPLEEAVIDQFTLSGVQGAVKIGGYSIHLQRALWVRPKDGDVERTAAALKAAGIPELVSETVNVNRLSAWARELDRMGEPIPPELDDYLERDERYRAIVRTARS